jgi:hypothetical protein
MGNKVVVMDEQEVLILFYGKDSVDVRLIEGTSTWDKENMGDTYMLNGGEYIHFFHETRNFFPTPGFYDLTGNLPTLPVVHSQMDGRKAPTSKTMWGHNEVSYSLIFLK